MSFIRTTLESEVSPEDLMDSMSSKLRSFLCAFHYFVDGVLAKNTTLCHMNYRPHVLQPNSWVLCKKGSTVYENGSFKEPCLPIGSPLQVWSRQTAQEMVFITVASALTLEVSLDNESEYLFFRETTADSLFKSSFFVFRYTTGRPSPYISGELTQMPCH